MKIAVISPHGDDACFSVGLAVGSWLAAGHKVTVLNCFTRSEYAPFSDADSVHAKDRMSFVTALRKREEIAWQRRYRGALRGEDLNLKDAPWRLHCGLHEVSTAVELTDKAAGKIAKALAKLAPDAIVAPLALGGHVDHRTARDAALAWATPEASLSFYEDLPYAAAMDSDTAIATAADAVAGKLGSKLAATFAAPPADPAGARTLKRRLALCFDSQISDATAEAIAEFSARYGGRERLWANPAWLSQLA